MRARQIASQLRQGLERAQRERQPAYMRAQARKAAALGAAALLASTAIYWRWQRRYRRSKQALAAAEAPPNPPTAMRLNRRQNRHLSEVGHRLLQLAQIGIWLGSSLTACSLFPQTRIIPIFIASSFGLPLKIALVGFGIYLIVRLSYALIDRLTALLANNALMTPEANWRLQLRASTISGVAKSIATGSWLVIGMLAGLTAMGVNTGPLLAGAGLIGVGLSFAAQNLIRDFINGFLIVLEDQYAVGDWIAVSSPNGDVDGLVEKVGLRITQLRDAGGRLVTVPNSAVAVVANFSSNWSRADLKIPVAYQADTDGAIATIERVASTLSQDRHWRPYILEKPRVLGVDDFGDRGTIVRVWIKTQPMKQWAVARECRRRIKSA